MSTAIELLKFEHRIILALLQRTEELVSGEDSVETAEALRVIGTLVEEFVDQRHQAKEEDILFQEMASSGFSRESGPLAVMLQEHEAGLVHMRAVREILAKASAPSAEDWPQLKLHAQQFTELLRVHIMKEDTVIYPMALRALSPDRLARLDERVQEYEASRPTLEAAWPRLGHMARTLSPKTWCSPSASGGCLACGAR